MTEPAGERPFMPDYGTDTTEWEALPWSWAAERLAKTKNFWIVTASAEGRPHVSAAWAVWDDKDHQLLFSCGPRSRKARNVAANPHVAVAVDDTVESVTLEGRATAVTHERAAVWIERYLAKYAPIEPSLTAEFLRQNMLFEVVPERAFAVIERPDEFAARATRWRFTEQARS